jgi:gamma-glutamylcyclotransferase (GGCT)/AIG2-like uncharacterized protein YtfP
MMDEITAMENLFAYGTLMCNSIMREVSGCRLSAVPGTLKGYSRRCVRGEHYPAILPHRQGRVAGVLYREVPDAAWERLDRFEGELYVRRRVAVALGDGAVLLAATYVVAPEFLYRLDQADWDFAEFLQNGKTVFQRDYKGYLSL